MEPRSTHGEQLPQTPQPEQWAAPAPTEHLPNPAERREIPQPVIEQAGNSRVAEVASQPPLSTGSLPAPQTDDVSALQVTSDDTPLVAADEDVIEKEWVDKAKKIIAETKDDPYQREQRIKKLQVEYLRKRYGREIGEAMD